MVGQGLYTENFQCAYCGKIAYKNGTWGYRRRVPSTKKKKNLVTIYFCGYSCMRAWDKAHEQKGGVAK